MSKPIRLAKVSEFGLAESDFVYASTILFQMFLTLLREEGFESAASCLVAAPDEKVYAALRVLSGEYKEGCGDEAEDRHHHLGTMIARCDESILDNWRITAAADRMTAMLYTGSGENLDEELHWFVQEWPKFVEACGEAVCSGRAGALSSRIIGIAEYVTKVLVVSNLRDCTHDGWDLYRAMDKKTAARLVAEDAEFDAVKDTERDGSGARWKRATSPK